VIAILALTIPSCDKFLEEKLVSDVSGAGYYTTAAGLVMLWTLRIII